MIVDNDYSFIFSSFEPMPDFFFQGYCYINNDLIMDYEGAILYPNSIKPFNDGCYFTLFKEQERYVLGVDSNGFNKLYIYSSNGIWAVSNSIYNLAKFLHSKNIRLKSNYSVLASLFNINTVSNQISTLSTVFNEIKLVPHEAYLEVLDNVISVKPKQHMEDKGYIGNLQRYVEIWISRIETLIVNDKIHITSELTGGIDSRVVYSLFYAALTRLGIEEPKKVHFRSSKDERYRADLSCATRIVDRYKGELNIKFESKRFKMAHDKAYQKWKDLNLGGYSPIYMPTWELYDDTIHFGGGGGEVHRSQYGRRELLTFAKGQKNHILRMFSVGQNFDLEELLDNYVFNMLVDVHEVGSYASNNNIHPLVLHYREFRNRYHAGRSPQYGRTVAPLGSDYLTACSSFCEIEKLNSNQILYDIMESLCPGLSTMPYDMESKFPSYDSIKSINIIPFSKESNPGKIYKNLNKETYDKDLKDYKTPYFSFLKYEISDFIKNYDNKFFTEDYVKNVLDFMEQSIENKRFSHAAKASSVAHLLIYKMMLDFAES